MSYEDILGPKTIDPDDYQIPNPNEAICERCGCITEGKDQIKVINNKFLMCKCKKCDYLVVKIIKNN